VLNGQVDKVRALLKDPWQKVDIEEDVFFRTPFFVACALGNLEIVRLLLEHPKVDINTVDCRGFTPFSRACLHGHTEIVKLLAASPKLNIDIVKMKRSSPLLLACIRGSAELVAFLLEDPATDRNKVNTFEQPPLLAAYTHQNFEVLKLLIADEKTDLNKPNLSGKTLLQLCCEDGAQEIFDLLINLPRLDLNKYDLSFATPLWHACANGFAYFVERFLEKPNLDVNYDGPGERTPLMVACKNDQTEVVKLLLRDPRVELLPCDVYDLTPLGRACFRGHPNIVEIFLNSNRVTHLESEKPGLFALACESRSAASVHLLLEHPAFLAKKIPEALARGLLEACEQAKEEREWVAGELAEGLIKADVLSACLAHANILTALDLNRVLSRSCRLGLLTVARDLLALPQIFVFLGPISASPFMRALDNDHHLICALLLSHPEFDSDFQDSAGDFLLLLAVKRGRIGVVRALLCEGGASTMLENEDEENALRMAVTRGFPGILKLLLAFHPTTAEGLARVNALRLYSEGVIGELLGNYLSNPALAKAGHRKQLSISGTPDLRALSVLCLRLWC